MKTTLKKLLAQKDWIYVNPNITDKNFPLPGKIETENWKIITMPKSCFTSQEALDEIKRQSCRPANCWEFITWANTYRDEIPKGKWYVALGQLWYGVGYHRVPYVHASSDGVFEFCLGRFEDDWNDDYCLLCFCDKTSPLALGNSEKSLDSLTLEKRVKELEDKMSKLQKFLILE